jgi:hypothetical protein
MALRLLFCTAALVTLACGGEDRGRPSGAPLPALEPGDQCELERGYEFQNIVSFERPFAAASPCDRGVPCPGSPLYFNYDKTHSVGDPDAVCPNLAEVIVAPDGNAVNPSAIPEGSRCGSESALRIQATNMATCYGDNGRVGWGGSLDITLSDDYFDASDWDGVSLWVRRGESPNAAFILSVIDEPNLGLQVPESEELRCNCREEPSQNNPSETRIRCYSDPDKEIDSTDTDAPPFPDELRCDAFGSAVSMTDTWQFITIPFSEMRQKGFGFVSNSGRIDTTRLKRIQVLIAAGDWDFWIDDIGFYRMAR